MVADFQSKDFADIVAQHKAPEGVKYSYGTAGFRMKAENLPCAVFRVGLLSSLRSAAAQGDYVGVMITASHNPVHDNGVKMIDPDGGMLNPEWESYAGELACLSASEVPAYLEKIAGAAGAGDGGKSVHKPRVLVARDTRPSGAHLVGVLSEGISAAGGSMVDLGELTTPQLHLLVKEYNNPAVGPHIASECMYYHTVADAFHVLVAGIDTCGKEKRLVTVDAANGVGGPAMKQLKDVIGSGSEWKISVANDGQGGGVLNDGCGSDFVKVGQIAPHGVEVVAGEGALYSSFDGDADRVVCYYRRASDGAFRLFDGDKIMSLYATFVVRTLKEVGLTEFIDVICVQTAYANGASTKYLKDTLGLEVAFTSTGVKNLHHRATECDGVAIYFEANGHGTVLFGPQFHKAVARLARPGGEESHAALRRIRALAKLINPCVGDAMTDLLAVLGVLSCLGWSNDKWDSLYEDLPNRLGKVGVNDRSAIITENADTIVVSPAGLQEDVNAAVAKRGAGARSFVRPSGTEDVVRVYAEATTQEDADGLCEEVTDVVIKYCRK